MKDEFQKIKLKIKKYLELDNVSVLAGAGTSFHLGTPIIRTIPETLKEELTEEIKRYFGKGGNPSYEELFNCLQADKFLKENKKEDISQIKASIVRIQSWLFDNCNTDKASLHSDYSLDNRLQDNRYYYHEMLIKKLLQRPINLKRANLFTTNYDMAFDKALDNLGVNYLNGFLGVHNRFFKPESFDYDLYYPGQSVSGKVHRAEKVIRYYKLHGSLSWIGTKETVANPYGIQEISIGDKTIFDEEHQLMVFPCASKKAFTLDLPYSELLRNFAKAIIQPQSVLITLGYSFYDEHINDIIYQALSIPSFTLIVVNYNPSNESNDMIENLRKIGDKRIIILDEKDKEQSSFTGFVHNVMPDLYEEDENCVIAETMSKLDALRKGGGNQNDETIIDIGEVSNE